jgi:hypothetical protein
MASNLAAELALYLNTEMTTEGATKKESKNHIS